MTTLSIEREQKLILFAFNTEIKNALPLNPKEVKAIAEKHIKDFSEKLESIFREFNPNEPLDPKIAQVYKKMLIRQMTQSAKDLLNNSRVQ